MDAKLPHHPHDAFFIRAMSDLRIAQDFLQQNLPPDLLATIDLSTLDVCKDRFIDVGLKSRSTDILYRFVLKGSTRPVYVATLIEHRSTPHKAMPLRVLYYQAQIMQRHWESEGTVPLVYGLVYYNGKTPWKYTRDIKDLIEAPRALVEQYALKPFHLVELNKIPDETLRKHRWAGLMGLAMKHIYDQDILVVLRGFIHWIKEIEQAQGHDFVLSLLYYTYTRGAVSDKDQFHSLLASELSEDIGENVMTLSETYTELGRKKGREEGREEGRGEGREEGIQLGEKRGFEQAKLVLARKLLAEGLDINFVSAMTGVSKNLLEEMEVC